jgi:hypothetical protein
MSPEALVRPGSQVEKQRNCAQFSLPFACELGLNLRSTEPHIRGTSYPPVFLSARSLALASRWFSGMHGLHRGW